jgi:hypothetical protein
MSRFEAKINSIAIFLEDIIPDQDMNTKNNNVYTPINLNEYEDYVEQNGEFNKSIRESDNLGERLELVGYIANTTNMKVWNKNIYKEFMLATVRHIASIHEPHAKGRSIDTYEFDSSNEEFFLVYVGTRDTIDIKNNCHHRIIITIATSESYPRRSKLNISNDLFYGVYSTLIKRNGIINNADKININNKIKELMTEYHDPKKVDQIAEIRSTLNETKENLSENIEKVIANSEQIDDLVQKSSDLSSTSKLFYKKTKKLNKSCCVIL